MSELRRSQRWALQWLVGFAVLCLLDNGMAQTAESSAERGERLFAGNEALIGTLVGHDEPLPAYAVRCINCHRPESAQGNGAVELKRATLLVAEERRGGPRSRYDLATFCRLVRTGVDPAYILIMHTMPRYDVDDAQCLALWNYLTLPNP